jgi:membrane protein YdbS with pleckstrin-like domain
MGIGISLLLIAAGAVLTWAVNFHVSGISIHLIGVILMVVGVIGLLVSLIMLSSSDRRTVVREQY